MGQPRPTNTNLRGKPRGHRAVGPGALRSARANLKARATLILSPGTRSRRSTAARHAAPPPPPLLRRPGPPLSAAAVRRHCAVRFLLGRFPVVVFVGGGGRAAGGECAQLRDGGLRAAAGAAVEQPVPARGGGKQGPSGGADSRGLGRGRAPSRQVGALPHRQGAPQVPPVQPRAPGNGSWFLDASPGGLFSFRVLLLVNC
jgi:hypothetical protein